MKTARTMAVRTKAGNAGPRDTETSRTAAARTGATRTKPAGFVVCLLPTLMAVCLGSALTQPASAKAPEPACPKFEPTPNASPSIDLKDGEPMPQPIWLVLSIDVCGRVAEATLEKGSGLRWYDKQVLEEARSWRFEPEIRDGEAVPYKVRMPIHTELDDSEDGAAASGPDATTAKAQPSAAMARVREWNRLQEPRLPLRANDGIDAYRLPPLESGAVAPADPSTKQDGSEQALSEEAKILLRNWKRMQVPKLPTDEQGQLEGYLLDPLPIEDSFAQVLAMLDPGEAVRPDAENQVKGYGSSYLLDVTSWKVYGQGYVFSPSLVRFRLVSDGDKSFWVLRTLCEAKPVQNCAKFEEYLRKALQPQKPGPPPPLP